MGVERVGVRVFNYGWVVRAQMCRTGPRSTLGARRSITGLIRGRGLSLGSVETNLPAVDRGPFACNAILQAVVTRRRRALAAFPLAMSALGSATHDKPSDSRGDTPWWTSLCDA